jgi:hypothetical protein
MSDNNSFNVVFNGGGGSGGGGGTINSGSNVGTGTIEVFKQVVGSDLEFRTILDTSSQGSILCSYVEGDIDPLLNNTIEANVILGSIGIRQSGGWYTFYDSLFGAFNDAVSGDVIEFFDDVVDTKTRTLNLVDGVDVNLNGYKYTYDPKIPDNTSVFNNSGSTTNNFRNGTLERIDAIAQTTLGECEVFSLFANNGEEININLNDCVLINASRNVISMLGDPTLMSMSGGTIYGGGTIDDGVNPPTFFSSYLGGNILNMNFRVNEIVVLQAGCNATNLTIYNEDLATNTGGISVDNGVLSNCFIKSLYLNTITDGTINNCTFISTIDRTLDCVSTELQNCTIEYNLNGVGSGNEALNIVGGTMSNCVVTSNVLSSVNATNCFILNSSIITSGEQQVVLDFGGNTFTNCTIYNKNDDNTGNLGGVYLYGGLGGDSIYSNNTIILSDNLSSAFNGATPTIDVYILSCVIQGTTNVVDVNVNNIQALTIDILGIIIQG